MCPAKRGRDARQIPSGRGRIVARPSKAFSKLRPDARNSVSGHGLRLKFLRILSLKIIKGNAGHASSEFRGP